jgi:hypothetical protein
MTQESPPLAQPFKDKKTGLLVFGIFEILLGTLCGLLLLVSVLGQLAMAHRPEMAGRVDQRALLPTVAMMGGMALAFVWLGIGSIQARRWARAIGLCLGWIGLLIGVFSGTMLIWMLPQMDAAMRQNFQQTGQQVPDAALLVMKVVMVATMLVFYVVIPGALVLFYRSRHVKLTCEARDPVPRWTDRCPLPVLAVVLIQAFGAAGMLLMLPVYGRAFPLFGLIITGLPSTGMYLAFAAFSAYAARGFYRLQSRAFWLYFTVMVVFGVSAAVTFSGGRLMAYYQAIGLPEAQLRQMEQMPMMHSNGLIEFCLPSWLFFFGYLFWLKKYFVAAEA